MILEKSNKIMNRYLIFILFIITFYSIPLYAQYDIQKGKELIKKSSSIYKSYQTVKADFKLTSENKMDNTKSLMNGTFYLKDKNFRLILGDQIVICDQKNMWTYLKEVNEVQINTYDPDALEINPNNLFIMWETGYLCGYAGTTNDKGKVLDLIELTPEDKSKPYFKVKLYLDKSTSHVQKVMIFEKNSSITTFEIKSMSPNVNLSDDLFKFNASKYPGVEIIDLRD